MEQQDLAERRGRVDSTLQNHDEDLEEHDERLTRVEKFMYIAMGAIAALSLAFGSAEVATFLTGM